MKRRDFVYQASLGSIALAAGCRAQFGALPDSGIAVDAQGPITPPPDAAQCDPTDADIEGPYYREGIPVRDHLDIHGDEGEPLRFGGTVTDLACAPIANAVVELWQANPAGDYDITGAQKRYYGQVATDAEGAFQFTTLMPGRYLNGPTYRPAHLHIKVWVGGVQKLTTQIYFDGDPYNEGDAWYDPTRSVAVQDGEANYRFTVGDTGS